MTLLRESLTLPYPPVTPNGQSFGSVFKGLTPVGTRPGHGVAGGANSNGTDTWQNSQVKQYIAADCADICLVYTNWYDGDKDGTHDLTVKASLHIGTNAASATSNVLLPVRFNGSTSVVIPVGGTVVSDPVGVDFLKGASVFVRTLVTVASGGRWPFNLTTRAADGEGVIKGSGTVTDMVLSTNTFTASSTNAYGPQVILAARTRPARIPVINGLGDSLMDGLGEAAPETDLGFLARALGNEFAYVRFERSGSTGVAFVSPINGTSSGSMKRYPLASAGTHAVIQFGINDLNTGSTFEQTRDARLRIADQLAIRGVEHFFGTTLGPWTTSTDNWATLENQTVKSWESQRLLFNAWVRSLPAPFDNMFEMADVLESGRDSGKWPVTGHSGVVTTVNGSATVTVTSGTFGNGEAIFGAGIPANTKIVSGAGTSSLLLDTAATASASGVTATTAYTPDGIHPGPEMFRRMALAIDTDLFRRV